MRIDRGHAQRRFASGGLVPHGDLPDQRVHVGVLEQRRERMPPTLSWTAPCSVGFSALLRLFWGYGFDFIGVDAECGELFASSFSV